MNINTDLPFVSFCLTSYNQRQYIGAAVEAALEACAKREQVHKGRQ